MRPQIAVATVSGKAYYRLVNELKRRELLFLSLRPGEPIPPSVKIVITTEKEKPQLRFPTILVYDADSDPSDTIDAVLRTILNKEGFEEITIGVDPGKTYGIAVIGDRNVLRREDGLSLEKALDIILTELTRNPAKAQRVKIGSGVPELTQELSHRLKNALSDNVKIEMVSEVGTSFLRNRGIRKKLSDADSALNIAAKKGRTRLRRKAA